MSRRVEQALVEVIRRTLGLQSPQRSLLSLYMRWKASESGAMASGLLPALQGER
jgi:hypothetical protein